MNKREKIRKSEQLTLRESLYLDSELVAKSGIFYIVMTKGKILSHVSEITSFNRDWAQEICKKCGYENYYLAIKPQSELEQLGDINAEGYFLLSQAGIAEVLSAIQRFMKSSSSEELIAILDQMIKDANAKTRPKLREDRLKLLDKQLNDAFDLTEKAIYNTNYDGEVLAVHILRILARVYMREEHTSALSSSEIGGMIQEIQEKETRFHELLKRTSMDVDFESEKCLELAKAIRRAKLDVYALMYQNIIHRLNPTKENTTK